MKLEFDIKKSLKVNPPNYEEGINFIRREAGRLEDLITKDENGVSLQPREKEIETGADLKNSFMANGVLYDREVMVVEQRKDGKKEMITGFNRDANLKSLDVTHYFWDLVTFDSPLDKVIAKLSLNATKDHVAKGVPNKETDYLLGLREANKIVTLNNKSIRQLLRDFSQDTLSKYQMDNIMSKWFKSNSLDSNVVALNTPMANEILKGLGLPHKGYVNDPSLSCYGRIGFASWGSNGAKGYIPSWIDLYDKHNTPIELYCFVQDVASAHIRTQRQRVFEDIENAKKWIKKHMKAKYAKIIDMKGFIAQISSPNPIDGGRRKERGIVNIDGEIIIDTPDGL